MKTPNYNVNEVDKMTSMTDVMKKNWVCWIILYAPLDTFEGGYYSFGGVTLLNVRTVILENEDQIDSLE